MQNLKSLNRKQLAAIVESEGLYLPNDMLAEGSDAKTVKGLKYNYKTGICYLIPDDELCPASKIAGCRNPCLVYSGRGRFDNVFQGRLNKTKIFKQFPEVFYEAIRRDIAKLTRRADRAGMEFCVRLNGTSDLDHTAFIASMPDTQFYDYTKRVHLLKVAKKANLDNYHLTFSYSGASEVYLKHVQQAIDLGANVAVVFSDKNQPSTFQGLPVVNGDDSDLRFLDYKVEPLQAAIGLYAKGSAKKDVSGFVVQTNIIAVAA